MNPVCVMLMGIPGSGKTRLALNIQKKWSEKNYHILSTDDIFTELGKSHGWSYNDAFNRIPFQTVEDIFYDRYIEYVADRKNIIIDQTNVTRYARQKKLNYLTSDYIRVGIYVDTPLQEIRRRLELRFEETGKDIPEENIKNMISKFQVPTLAEFDNLFFTSKLTKLKDLFA
jgi:predicted kinase